MSYPSGLFYKKRRDTKKMGKYGIRANKSYFKEAKADKIVVEDKVPVQFIIPETVAESTTSILEGWDVNSDGTTAKTNDYFKVQPPYPMQLSVQAVAEGTADGGDILTVAGYDAKGESVSEEIALQATAAGINYSDNAFAKLTTITPNSAAVKSTDVNVGYRKIVGLPYPIAQASDIMTYTYDGEYGTANVDSLTVSTTYDTVTLPTMAASKTVNIMYLSKLQE